MSSKLKCFAYRLTATALAVAQCTGLTADDDPFADLDKKPTEKSVPSTFGDPFADLDAPEESKPTPLQSGKSPFSRFLEDGLSLKNELMFEFSRSSEAANRLGATADGWYSRNSAGFELLKKFSTDTATVAAFDVQVRLVRRDNYHEVMNDAEGADRRGWFLEYHNLYWDFYNVFNPLLSDEARGENAGRFNVRIGRFYVPFGLNLQTDTHGTMLQLSNERNFGFERDWYAGFWGSINPNLNYDCYYLLGSGYDIAFKGQSGLVGSRLSLSNKYLYEYGLEGGVSLLAGQRISKHSKDRSPSVAARSNIDGIIDTVRYGGDLRWRHTIPTGSIMLTCELSAGRDERDNVLTQLYQADYLTRNRKFGVSSQYRRFKQDIRGVASAPSAHHLPWNTGEPDASVVGEITWYFRNDLSNANLHWVKLNIEQETQRQRGKRDTLIALQYYRYW